MVDTYDETPVSSCQKKVSLLSTFSSGGSTEKRRNAVRRRIKHHAYSTNECQHMRRFILPTDTALSEKTCCRFCFVARGTERLTHGPLLRAPPPPSPRCIRLIRSWAGDISGGDLVSKIRSGEQVDFVYVDIASAEGISCDRILVSPDRSVGLEGGVVAPPFECSVFVLGWAATGWERQPLLFVSLVMRKIRVT